MRREDRHEFLKIVRAHHQTIDLCETCATTTRELAAEVARGGIPPRDDLIKTMHEADRVLSDLSAVRAELRRLISEVA
jgi:hypothetical protein